MKVAAVLAIVMTLTVVSCGLGRSSTLETRSAEYSRYAPNEEAVVQLTNARCDREVSCMNVGPKRRFADRAACAREIRRKLEADLGPKACPQGIERGKLSVCAAVAREERCDNLLDTIDRAMSCRRRELCT